MKKRTFACADNDSPYQSAHAHSLTGSFSPDYRTIGYGRMQTSREGLSLLWLCRLIIALDIMSLFPRAWLIYFVIQIKSLRLLNVLLYGK